MVTVRGRRGLGGSAQGLLVLPALAVVALAVVTGCGGESERTPGPGSEGGGGAGLAGPCAPGEQPLDDGGCRPAGEGAGVPPEQCAAGFEPTDAGGCAAIMPAGPCPAGQIAVPGDETCHELAACGTTPWGDIPVDSATVYVDGAYAGNGSDGSSTHPWTTIQAAVTAAPADAVVAIAAGTYAEDVDLGGKPLRLWGRCPSLVEVQGQGAFAAVTTGTSATVDVRQLAITGPDNGLLVESEGALVDSLWLHDLGGSGVLLSPPAAAVIRNTLVERYASNEAATLRVGIYARGATATIEGSAVRNTLATGDGGRGINVLNLDGIRSTISIQGSLVDQARTAGVFVQASDVVIGGTLIRHTAQSAAHERGYGVFLQPHATSQAIAVLEVTGSVITGNHVAGLFADGCPLTVQATVVSDTQPGAGTDTVGRGIHVEDTAATPGLATITNALVTGNHEAGVAGIGAELVIEDTIIRATAPSLATGGRGRGISLGQGDTGVWPLSLTLRGSLVEHNHEAAVVVAGGAVTVEATSIVDTLVPPGGMSGRGLNIQMGHDGTPATGVVRWSTIERNVEAGIIVASDIVVEDCLIRDTVESPVSQLSGWGLGVQIHELLDKTISGTVRRTLFENNQGAGIAVFGSDLEVTDSIIRATTANAAQGGTYGDGIAVTWHDQTSTVAVRHARVADNARAGIAVFGSQLALGDTELSCNAVHLNGEDVGYGFEIQDEGGNQCGCGDQSEVCKVLSAKLTPPDPLP